MTTSGPTAWHLTIHTVCRATDWNSFCPPDHKFSGCLRVWSHVERVGDGPREKSGETIPDLPLGIHTIEFQEAGNWIKPENEEVMIEGGQPITFYGVYSR